ncbi:hypothetical protein [Candidatus Binatus sp.]|jgi:hypothetical protein|uniref:hypothetical protein n=1 Tax=Candidatus Binatus sp. TaxID=2811406 RepID=UPI003BE51F53
MSQQSASGSWGTRPSKKNVAAAPAVVATLDKVVNGGKEETVRLNVEIPKALRARVKVRCAMEGREIKNVVIELLQQRFPE